MKIGDIKVKRNYLVAQMVLDVLAAAILIVIVQCIVTFADEVNSRNELITSTNNVEITLVDWKPNLIWGVLAVIAVGVSLFLTYKPKKLPKKYKINSENAQKYSDIYITAVTCLRIPLLLAIFDMMYIHQQNILYINESWFSYQVLLDIILSVIVIRFSMHRVRAIEPKEEEKKRTIVES